MSGGSTDAPWALHLTTSCTLYVHYICLALLSHSLERYESVWEETLKTYHEMVAEEGWTNKDRIYVPAVQNLTFKVSLRAYVPAPTLTTSTLLFI